MNWHNHDSWVPASGSGTSSLAGCPPLMSARTNSPGYSTSRSLRVEVDTRRDNVTASTATTLACPTNVTSIPSPTLIDTKKQDVTRDSTKSPPYPSPPASHHPRSSPPSDTLAIQRSGLSYKKPRLSQRLNFHDPSTILTLTLDRIEDMVEEYSGRVVVPGVTDTLFDAWQSLYPEAQEADNVTYEYDASTSRFIVKCGTMPVHESVSIFFTNCVSAELHTRLGRDLYEDTVQVSSGATYAGFTGDKYRANSQKVPDAYLHVDGDDFPRVVCETGWAEGMDDLKADARLWLLGSDGQTCVVIVVAFQEATVALQQSEGGCPTPANVIDGDERAVVDGIESSIDNPYDPSHDQYPEEQALLSTINDSTRFLPLASDLLALHRQDKLSKPLLGRVDGTVHIFRANPARDAIIESFTATLLPNPPTGTRQSFSLAIEDLVGRAVAEANGLDPQEQIFFSLSRLWAVVAKQIPKQEKKRSMDRAVVLMKERGLWKDMQTFAQSKRKRKRREEEE